MFNWETVTPLVHNKCPNGSPVWNSREKGSYFIYLFAKCLFYSSSPQLCLTLCDPMDCNLPGSSVYGILQARILKWVAIPFSGDHLNPRIEPRSPTFQGDSLPSEPPGKPACPIRSDQSQSCRTLCDPMNCSTPGLPVHHQLPEFTETHVHRVSDAIQPSHPVSSPSPPAPNLSQHQSLFQWVNSSHEVAKVLEFQL